MYCSLVEARSAISDGYVHHYPAIWQGQRLGYCYHSVHMKLTLKSAPNDVPSPFKASFNPTKFWCIVKPLVSISILCFTFLIKCINLDSRYLKNSPKIAHLFLAFIPFKSWVIPYVRRLQDFSQPPVHLSYGRA